MFRTLIGTAGLPFFVIALFARLPFSMSVVGVLTAVAAVRGSFVEAGLTAALVGAGSALLGPFVGGLADQHGQRWVVFIAALANAASLLGLSAVLLFGEPESGLVTVGLYATGFLVGATAPQVSPMVRVRWIAMIKEHIPALRREKAIGAALSYESMADELVFVFGPVLVGVAAALYGPTAPIIGAAILTTVFVSAFALHSSAKYAAGSRADARAGRPVPRTESALRTLVAPQVALPVLGMASIGLLFGSALTSLTAFMDARGVGEATGLLYGAMGVGSAICALAVALLPQSFSLRARWIVFATFALGCSVFLPFVDSVSGMAVLLLVLGCGVGPSLVNLYSIAARVSAPGRITTIMAAMASAVVVGQSANSAIAGTVVEGWGYTAGQWLVVASVAGLLVLGIIVAALPETKRDPRRETVSPDPTIS